VFIGNNLLEELDNLASGGNGTVHKSERMSIGVSTLPVLHKDDTDRNRTSPFAFTGDKFEFRMVGSSQSLGLPNTTLNTIVAEMLMRIADRLDAAQDKNAAWQGIMAELIGEHRRIIFNGNNYSQDWAQQAKELGLPIIDNTVDAIGVMGDAQVQDVFARHGVFQKSELDARRDIAWTNFTKLASIEAVTTLKMSRQKILPAAIRYSKSLAEAVNQTRQAGANVTAQQAMLNTLCDQINVYYEAIEALAAKLEEARGVQQDSHASALCSRNDILPLMQQVRQHADQLERLVDKAYWPLPSYGEMLFGII